MSFFERADRQKENRVDNPSALKWASGRRLTTDQRARKRAVDRTRSRRQRLSTLNRIAELEAQVQSVMPELFAVSLGQQTINENGGEFSVTMRANNDAEGDQNRPSPSHQRGVADWSSMISSGDTIGTSSLPSYGHREYQRSSINGFDNCQEQLVHLNSSNFWDSWIASPPAPGLQLHSDFNPQRDIIPVLTISDAVRSNTRKLTEAQQFRKAEVCLDDQTNQDALIRAVIEGWDVVEAREKFCPLWEILRTTDRLLFCMASHITRLVMLRMIHYMLLFKVCCKRLDELPPWYRPRPAQVMFPHDELADFFAWPGMRERLVISKETLLTNDFWDCFRRNFRFQWPFAFQEVYQVDLTTGRFRFSPLFKSHHREISMWQMEQRFFTSFPELSDDIKAAEPIFLGLTAEATLLKGSLHERDLGSLYNTDFDSVNALNLNGIVGFPDHDAPLSAQRLDMFDANFNAL